MEIASQTFFGKVKFFMAAHKFFTIAFIIIVMGGGYWWHAKSTSTSGVPRYVTAIAAKDTLVASISGTGQVSPSNQIDLKSKASGEILALPVSEGGSVGAGTVIAYIDPSTAQKAVRDASTTLETAQLTLAQLMQPVDHLQLTQSENSLARAISSKQNTEDDLTKTYDDTFNSISNAFLDLPSIVSGLHDLLFTTNAQLGGNNVNNIDYYASTAALYDVRGSIYGADTNTKYQDALAKYNKNFQDYKNLDRGADRATMEGLLAETHNTALAIAEAVKSTNNLIQFFTDQMTQHNQRIPALVNTQLSTLNTYTGTMNTHLTDFLAKENTIKSDKNALVEADRSIDESTQSLEKLKAGPTALDIRAAQLTVQAKQEALNDAKKTLADYVIRAQFSGTLAKLTAKKGDTVGSGTSVGTLITKEKIAGIALNEVDVAKIKVGDKATLTFDAIDGLSITGVVAEIDTVGTVTQGVVSYTVKISFDTPDDRVKAGMSVSAAIITNVKTDVLTVQSSAVKTQGGASYVEVFNPPLSGTSGNQGTPSAIPPERVPVEVGLSNDTKTEITSGLKEGDQVVVRTISASATAGATTQAPSLFPTGGNRGAAAGARIPRGD